MTPISERQRARFYIYKNQKDCETFIYKYKNPDTLQKSRQSALRFYSQIDIHFRLHDFHEIFEIGIYIYTKIMTLCVTYRFYIRKARHFETKQHNLRYIF